MKDDFTIKGEVISALEGIDDPQEGASIVDSHMVEQVEVDSGVVDVTLVMEASRDREQRFAIEDGVYDNVEEIAGVQEVKVKTMTPKALEREADGKSPTPSSDAQPGGSGGPAPGPSSPAGGGPSAAAGGGQPGAGAPGGGGPQQTGQGDEAVPLEGVGKVLAVASGKGGVGKSTVAVNLALSLKEKGYRVGLLDVDIYGPSLPTLLGVEERPAVSNRRILPIEASGLRLMSLGFLMDEDSPVIWRGPIVTGIIRQFLRDVDWSGIDYLVVDMPPGTGDAQLALAQTVPVDGAMIVTTPSDLSLVDASRGLEMFKTLNVDVMGIVTNMSEFIVPSTGEKFNIFGDPEDVEEASKRLEVPILGEVPLDPEVRKGGDAGEPVVVGAPDSPVSGAFMKLAESVINTQPLGDGDGEADGKDDKGLFSFLKK